MVYSRKGCDFFNYMTLWILIHLVLTTIPRYSFEKALSSQLSLFFFKVCDVMLD